jgi:RNA polymerase sigma factor (sigma-70 family)
LVAALEQWPESGVPRNPGAWLMTTGKRRAIDLVRRSERLERKLDALAREHARDADPTTSEGDAYVTDEIEDDLLRLLFIACHPVLSTDAQVALTLRVVAGLTTAEIARAFLVSESTIAQRVVRAKRTLASAGIPFELPPGPELAERLSSVLDVIYLVFNEGYAATTGSDWMRNDVCDEARRLGRILAELMPNEPEVHGLVGLMEIQASRSAARTTASGQPVLLHDQDRTRWNRLLIHRGLAALDRAEALGATPGPYTLQAAIAACHVRAPTPDETDWVRMTTLYQRLAELQPSPVVELNRAVALAMAYGPAKGLELVDTLTSNPTLAAYHHLPSVRGNLLARLGRVNEARDEFTRAAALTRNETERILLLERASTM